MNKEKIVVWGREFELEVNYDCYEGEEILEEQRLAAAALAKSAKALEGSLEKVKEYCLSVNGGEIGADSIENIFRYVMPKYLFAPREEGKRVLALMCNYKFDQEHGIAVVFENERFAKVGKQDIVL